MLETTQDPYCPNLREYYLTQKWDSLKSTIFNTCCHIQMGFTQAFDHFAVEFNLIQRRCLMPHGNKYKSKTFNRHNGNVMSLAKGALQTFLYLPSKSRVNICLHCLVQSSSLNWIPIMLFQVCKRHKGLKNSQKTGLFSSRCLEAFQFKYRWDLLEQTNNLVFHSVVLTVMPQTCTCEHLNRIFNDR